MIELLAVVFGVSLVLFAVYGVCVVAAVIFLVHLARLAETLEDDDGDLPPEP